ncbi:nucleoside monophosphate kinase, partial [Bacillus sp. WP8]|uniref:nucleoside monophosphate kinase n=1 Tax=Bacillus sp. WP8 TaxID=756828 RepID=UPI00164318E3
LVPHDLTIPILTQTLPKNHSQQPFLLHPFPPTLPHPQPLQQILNHLRTTIHYLINIKLHKHPFMHPLTPPTISKNSPPTYHLVFN